MDSRLLRLAALLLVGAAASNSLAKPVDADLLLKGGTLCTGVDAEPEVGDVAVRGDRIVAVGRFEPGKIGHTIDCQGLVVAPGFIDLHNHSDQTIESDDEDSSRVPRILADQTRESAFYLTQGCTTLVTGNCGGGALDVAAYYHELDERPAGVNVAHLVPQGAVRSSVIGAKRRPAEGDEVERMRALVRQGMEAGAWGMSTGLQYVPSAYADAEEIAKLAEVVAEFGGIYASHIRDEGDELVESVEEALRIGRLSGAAVHVSHFKASKRRNWGKVRAAAEVIARAQDEGLTVTADQYPYAASSTSVAAMLLPDEEREGSRQDLTDRLGDPAQLARLRPIMQDLLEARGGIMVADCPSLPKYVGRMIRDIAKEEGRAAVDVAIDVVRAGEEAGVSFSMDERDVRWVMSLPWVATASDGSVKVPDGTKPHPRSFGTFPRKIGRYAAEEGVVSLARAVRSASGLPADILGMEDRGYLREGLAADIVVLDAATFRDHATFESPTENSTGVRWLLVNGELAIDDGQLVKTDAGRTLRKPSAAE
ncbi:D-aminoacylase [Posidoniimonas polymericola]|uniref:D-aminoacylase n=1 Tax=Posidoniimonas polymericola TaxID=2528002 RepID=A0A5C5YSW9_9BACT|nr:amidohydrolase family protein [Posidoniimonas polymericola]TWT77747.1 D-aminoacylase [Posidoniimonas polymericola]